MKTKILADFQSCISVPLTMTNWFEYKKKLSRNLDALMVMVSFMSTSLLKKLFLSKGRF